MAGAAARVNGRPVLELGPGTGVVTAAILKAGVRPQRLVAVEHTEELLPDLGRRFPGVHFIGGDAFKLSALLQKCVPVWRGQFGAVISSLPLRNFPVAARDELLAQLSDWMHPDATIVQFSYSLRRERMFNGLKEVASEVVWLNVPPARVSEYALNGPKAQPPNRPGGTKADRVG